jgi:AcrR family transcriptional regulator
MSSHRDRIVAATAESFRHRGFNGTSLKDITSAAGAPTGSVYHFFPGGKTELAVAVVTESGAAYRELFEAIADEAPDPARAISDFFDGAADMLEQTGFVDICPIGGVAREIASTNEDLRVACDDVFTSWTDAATERLTEAGMSIENALPLATTFVATLEGSFVLARTRRDAEVVRRAGALMSTLARASLARPV